MAWSLAWTATALKDMRRLAPQDQRRVRDKLVATLADPRRHYTRLVGEDTYRLRVGDHRAIVLLLFAGQTIEVQAVLHRSTAYR